MSMKPCRAVFSPPRRYRLRAGDTTIGGFLHAPQEGNDIAIVVGRALGVVQLGFIRSVGFMCWYDGGFPLCERDLLFKLIPSVMHVQMQALSVGVSMGHRAPEDEVVSKVHEPNVDKREIDVQGDDQKGKEKDDEWRLVGTTASSIGRHGLFLPAR